MTKNAPNTTNEISYDEFLAVDIRVGKILEAEEFPEAHRPAYKLKIDFGEEIGVKKTSAQITQNYTVKDLIGKRVCAVVNFPKKQIGPFMSEVLTLGFNDDDGNVTLISPDKDVPLGGRLH